MRALDCFSGPRGWDVHDAELGIESDGIESDPSARATAEAAGFQHVGVDVRAFHLERGHGYALGKFSPPCQTFSMSGNGSGRRDLKLVLDLLDDLVFWSSRVHAQPIAYDRLKDIRTGLVLEPMRLILQALHLGEPLRGLALEQVPTVLPVWVRMAGHLERLGYSVAVGNLHAEQFGPPQTRKRAALVASLDRKVTLPAPTHSRYYSRDPKRLDEGVLPWVSMAEALGSGLDNRPSPTITGGGTYTGGAEPIAHLSRYVNSPHWVQRSNYSRGSSGSGTAEERGRTTRRLDEPSTTVTSKGFQWRLGDVRSSHGCVRDADQPAPTMTASMDNGNFRREDGETSVRVTVQEAGILQTFPANYPWQGTKTAQYQQVGNAIPPLLARAILQQVI